MTLVIAHRGASHAARENTIEAFELARALGADGVELDVRVSADGGLAVHHDAHLADGRAIGDLRFDELPPHVPSLGDALAACAGMVVNIELKNDPREASFRPPAELAARLGATLAPLVAPAAASLLISSFHRPTVDALAEATPGRRSALLVERGLLDAAFLASLADAGHVALNAGDVLVDAVLVDAVHVAGLELYVWTVDSPVRIAELGGWGVDGVISNRPDVARAALAGLGS
ncbi:MAG: glycerophosphodiester phosphodiesterase [Acidimicrobiia bacterium]|nr:glycerophosphodiester phosphodiesterase [Acidimicrobiia bacterium]